MRIVKRARQVLRALDKTSTKRSWPWMAQVTRMRTQMRRRKKKKLPSTGIELKLNACTRALEVPYKTFTNKKNS